MKLKDAIYKVDKSARNESWSDMEDFADILGFDYLSYNQEFSDQVKKYWLQCWMCTDTHVGFAVYYFKDEPVAVSFQSARKSDEEIEFVSEQTAEVVRAFILSLQGKEHHKPPVCNLEEDIGDSYTVSYNQQLLTKHGVYEGQDVEIVWDKPNRNSTVDWKTALIKLPDGEQKRVALSEVKIPFHLQEK